MATQIGISGKSYRLGDRNVVRTTGDVVYVFVVNITDGKGEMWKNVGGTWTHADSAHDQTAYTGSATCGAAITSGGVIHCVWWNASNKLYYNTFNTSTDLWGTAEQIISIAGADYRCAIALDASDKPHVIFTYTFTAVTIQYTNKVGANWKARVALSGTVWTLGGIAIDTNAAHSLYNLPQIVYGGSTYSIAALGNANDASSFVEIRPATNYSTGNNATICIDANGRTNVFNWRNNVGDYVQCFWIDGTAANWGTAGNWTKEGNITGVSTAISTTVPCIVEGTTRYVWPYYTTPAIYYAKSAAYAAWGAQLLQESPATAQRLSVRWQYANNPSYATKGVDYIYIIGAGTDNLYYNNIGVGVIDATVAATLGAATADAAGNPLSTMAAAATLPPVTAALSGTSLVQAAADTTLSPVTAVVAGTPVISAEIAAVLGACYADIEGAPTSATIGTIDASLSSLTANMAGTPIVQAAAAISLASLVADLEGSPIAKMTLAATLAQINALVAGYPLSRGQVAATTRPVTAVLQGTSSIPGTIAATIAALTARLEGSGLIQAALAPVLAAVRGTPVVSGDLSAQLKAIIGQMVVTEPLAITLAALLRAVTTNIDGAPIVVNPKGKGKGKLKGTLAATLRPVTANISGTPIIVGQIAAALSQVLADIQGEPSVAAIAVINATLAQVSAIITGTPVAPGQIDAILPPPVGISTREAMVSAPSVGTTKFL